MASSASTSRRSGGVTEDASVVDTSEVEPVIMGSEGVTEETSVLDTSEVEPVDDADSVTHYGMTSEDLSSDSVLVKKGKALIISNNFYGRGDERTGNEVDKEKLTALFDRIGFQTTVIEDTKESKYLSKEVVLSEFNYWSTNLSGILDDADCLIVVIMSHGGCHNNSKEEYISFADEKKLELSTIFEMFSNNRCKAMCGKPKLFFIQSCRGFKEDRGTVVTRPRTVSTSTDSDQHIEIANMADFLIAQSSYKGYKAYLTNEGSWFIQSLVEVFEMGIPVNKELHQMMIEVNRKVSRKSDRKASVGELGTGYIIKEVPSTTTTLTKNVFFQITGN